MTNDEIRPFVSDGCSGFQSFIWNKITGHCPPWEDHCKIHDRAYYEGGDLSLRFKADQVLCKSIYDMGYKAWSALMFVAVRIGGVYWINFPSTRYYDKKWHLELNGVRWGYKYKYPRYK